MQTSVEDESIDRRLYKRGQEFSKWCQSVRKRAFMLKALSRDLSSSSNNRAYRSTSYEQFLIEAYNFDHVLNNKIIQTTKAKQKMQSDGSRCLGSDCKESHGKFLPKPSYKDGENFDYIIHRVLYYKNTHTLFASSNTCDCWPCLLNINQLRVC